MRQCYPEVALGFRSGGLDVDSLSDAAFKDIVDQAPDAILLVDGEGRIAYVNRRADEIFGYEAAELLGQRVEVLIPEDKRSMHVIHREVYQERPERRPMGIGLDLAGRRKDGTVFPVEISLSPFAGSEGHMSVAVVRDVTRQRRAEETLRRSEERHRLLNERADNVVFRYRLVPSPAWEYVSSAVQARLGYAPEAFYVDDDLIFRITYPDDRHVMQQALSQTAPKTVALRMISQDGAVRWFELSITSVRASDGTVLALEGIARDVTERRAADEERRRLQAEVELQLERNRIAGDLHDDTIQSIYALGLQLHAARDDDSLTREAAVDQAIAGLNEVIAALRSYMHRLSGDEEVTDEQESIETRIRDLIAGSGRTRWEVEIDEALDVSPSLERHLYLLAKELIANVHRHAQAASAAIALHREDGGGILLQVRDDGIGFDRDSVNGDSFGLRSVDLRASTLGATIELDSTPGRGTCVVVRLPQSAVAAH